MNGCFTQVHVAVTEAHARFRVEGYYPNDGESNRESRGEEA